MDFGGLCRDWLAQLATGLFDASNGLVEHSWGLTRAKRVPPFPFDLLQRKTKGRVLSFFSFFFLGGGGCEMGVFKTVFSFLFPFNTNQNRQTHKENFLLTASPSSLRICHGTLWLSLKQNSGLPPHEANRVLGYLRLG